MKRRFQRCTRAALGAALVILGACATAPQGASLYERLGGEPGIGGIVQELLINIAADDRIRHQFEDVHIAGFRARLESHFCHLSGGPCGPPKRTMQESHERLGISAGEFNALVEALILAMERCGVDYGTQNAFLARLAPMQPDIVSGG